MSGKGDKRRPYSKAAFDRGMARINWTKREPGPSPARADQIERFSQAPDCRDYEGAKRVLNELVQAVKDAICH